MTEQVKDAYILMINKKVDNGIQVLCIDNKDAEEYLTKGKRYKVYSHIDNPSIRVICDNGECYSFHSERFQTKQDIREEKLKQLGI